jgi:uncharacterized membrane protein
MIAICTVFPNRSYPHAGHGETRSRLPRTPAMLGMMDSAQHIGWFSRLLDADVSRARIVRTDKLTWISRALSLTGFGIAAYLTTVYLQNIPPLCGTSGGCVTVQHSQYANLGGVPLPVLGLVGYALLFITACLPGQRARTAGMVFTVLAIAASLGLTYIELNVIHAICLWCIGSATCAALHVLVNSTRYVRGEPAVGPLADGSAA